MPRRLLPALVALALTAPALAQQPAMPPRQVGVVEMRMQDVPRIVTVPGRAIAGEQAAIRPRVSGPVTEVLYRPGTQLQAGTPMFRIDASTYAAGVTSAEANVAAARAAEALAASAFERAQRLAGSGVSQADVESAGSRLQQAQAQVQVAEAALDIARSELAWTTITSPISGVASVAAVSVGDLVTANQATALATVTRLDPIDVDMYEPSARILRVFDDIQSGRLRMNETLRATLTLETGETYSVTGELLAPGFSVSTTTGSVDNRFRFANPDRRLLPGMFVRGQIELGQTRALLVSQSATTRDRTGRLTAWVVEEGKIAQRVLTDDGTWQHNWIITAGLAEGELVVADGLTGLQPGMQVTTIPIIYDDQGVVRDAPTPAPTGSN